MGCLVARPEAQWITRLSIERVVGLVKIILAELVMVFTLSGAARYVVELTGTPGCSGGEFGLTISWVLIYVVLGLFAAAWLVLSILYARETDEEYQPTLRLGSAVMANLFVGPVSFPFCSTHPSYVFVDLITVGVMLLLISANRPCAYLFEQGRGVAGLILALSVPGLRLFSWYGLRHQTGAEVRDNAWKPVALLYAFVVIILVAAWLVK